MLVSQIYETDLTPELVDRLLYQGITDTGESADCAIVLGSSKAAAYRVPVAVDAYRAGRVKKLLLCGGKRHEFPEGIFREAAHMQAAALALGVPEADLLIEDASQNTIENILYGMIALQQAFCLNRVHRVLLVTTAYHMRRSLAIARYLFPAHIAVLPCPANDRHTRRENWTETPEGITRATGEAIKLAEYVRNGVIPDFEI